MERLIARLGRLSLVLLVAAIAPSCGDDDDGTGTAIDVSSLAEQMSRITSGVIVDDQTTASALELWRTITPVMANQSGVTPGSPAPVSGRTPAEIAELPPVVQALIRPREDIRLLAATQPPVPPLGLACDWNIETDRWKDAGDRIGLPDDDAIRFELYQVLGGKPTLPLAPIGTVIDVAPGTQGSTGSTVLDVKLNAGTPAQNGGGVLDLLLTGQWRTSELNLLMGGFLSAAGGRLDYNFRIDQAFAINDMTVEDLLISSAVTADFSNAATGSLEIDKSNSSSFSNLQFDYEFDRNTFAIITGTVQIDGEEVATMGGIVSQPIFTITSDRLTSADRAYLTSIFGDAGTMDQRITELWAWGYCLGADDAGACTLSAALLPG